MARKRKHVALPPPPDGSGMAPFDPRFMERLNRNYDLGCVVHQRLEELREHVGGDPSPVMESHIRRTVWLELVVAYYEQRFAEGHLNRDGHAIWTQCSNTLRGFLKEIGLERKARPVRSLRDVMNEPPRTGAA